MACSSLPTLVLLHVFLALPLLSAASGAFRVELIHRDSPRSPLHNPNMTLFDRLTAATRRSIARADHLRRRSALASDDSFESEVIPDDFEYLMSIAVGTPPFEIVAIADTGSDLMWANCRPCRDCYRQRAPLFDPNRSSTYRDLPCESRECGALGGRSCGRSSTCPYKYRYWDGSYTAGNLASETFSFNTTRGRRVAVPRIAFGCSHESRGTFDWRDSGLVGLGGGPLSLVSQLRSSIQGRFSYCLVPFSEPSSTSTLVLGPAAWAPAGEKAVSTPLVGCEDDTHYTVALEDIWVGDGRVPVNGDVIVDSGTTMTLLEPGVVQSLESMFEKMIDLPRVNDPEQLFDLCFDVSGSSSPDPNFPDIAFRFSGGTVTLSSMNTFVEASENMVCLAIVANEDISVLGNVAQQNFHVQYDLQERTVTFAPADCARL